MNTTANRRTFLRLAGLAAAAAAAPGVRLAAFAGKADALLLTCMDYRLVDATGRYMSGRGLKGDYDQVILAGAALGATTAKYPDWNRTFWEHLDAARQLHGIHKVIAMDHRDCGAYKLVLGEDLAKDPANERRVHAETLHTLRGEIHAKHPSLEVETLLMNLDGTVEQVGA